MKLHSQAVAGLSTIVLGSPGPAEAALGGDFRGTCLVWSLFTLPGFTLAHGTSVTCLSDLVDMSLSKAPETVGDREALCTAVRGSCKESETTLQLNTTTTVGHGRKQVFSKKKKKLIDGWKTKQENIAAQDNQDLRCKIFHLTARYKDTGINSSPFSCSGLRVGLRRT